MKKIGLLFIILTIMIGCKNSNHSVDLRIHNTSKFDFKNIIVNPSGKEINFGDLNSGEKSEYKKFKTVYPYAFIKVEINNEIYTFQPIDYTSETPLVPGKYTYEIGFDASKKELILTLVEGENQN